MNEAVKKKIALKPYILGVGTRSVNLSAYVIVDDFKYECNSVVDTLNLIFKIFFVSDSQYPTLSHHVGLFLQLAIYQISDNNKPGTVIKNMIQSFNAHKID